MPNLEEKIGTGCLPDDVLRNLVTVLIRQSNLSRDAIAEKLSLLVAQPISKRMLDDWTAGSKKRARFPACFVQGFCEVVGNDRLQRHLLSDRLRDLLSLGESMERLIAPRRKRPKR
jgi:hypothetical protein